MRDFKVVEYILNVTEIIAFLTGVFFLKKNKHNNWKWFVFYLGFILLSEVIGKTVRFLHFNNQYIYSYILIPIEFIFFHWLYYQYSTLKEKRRIIVSLILYIFSFIIEEIFFDESRKFFFLSFSYTIGNAVLLFIIFQYFFRLINSERILYFYQEHLFWISCGLLLFYLGTSPYFGLYNYLRNGHLDILYGYAYIMYFLNCSMYLLFAASFIWGKEK
jgi:hypothetical protein